MNRRERAGDTSGPRSVPTLHVRLGSLGCAVLPVAVLDDADAFFTMSKAWYVQSAEGLGAPDLFSNDSWTIRALALARTFALQSIGDRVNESRSRGDPDEDVDQLAHLLVHCSTAVLSPYIQRALLIRLERGDIRLTQRVHEVMTARAKRGGHDMEVMHHVLALKRISNGGISIGAAIRSFVEEQLNGATTGADLYAARVAAATKAFKRVRKAVESQVVGFQGGGIARCQAHMSDPHALSIAPLPRGLKPPRLHLRDGRIV